MRQINLYQASLLIALSGILYGFLGYLGTYLLNENMSIWAMLFGRFFIAGCWMSVFAIKKQSLKQVFTVSNQSALLFTFLLGAVCYTGMSAFYFIASQYTGTGLAMVIFFSYPLMVSLFSWLIQGQPLTFHTVIGLLVMMTGLFVLSHPSATSFDMVGVICGMLAAFFNTFYVIGSKRFASAPIDSTILTTIVCFGCALIFLIFTLSTSTFVLPSSVKAWVYLLVLGIFATALPIQLMLIGLKYVSSMRASLITVLEPLVTVAVGIVLLNESVSVWQMLGILMVLGSIFLVQFQREL